MSPAFTLSDATEKPSRWLASPNLLVFPDPFPFFLDFPPAIPWGPAVGPEPTTLISH